MAAPAEAEALAVVEAAKPNNSEHQKEINEKLAALKKSVRSVKEAVHAKAEDISSHLKKLSEHAHAQAEKGKERAGKLRAALGKIEQVVAEGKIHRETAAKKVSTRAPMKCVGMGIRNALSQRHLPPFIVLRLPAGT